MEEMSGYPAAERNYKPCICCRSVSGEAKQQAQARQLNCRTHLLGIQFTKQSVVTVGNGFSGSRTPRIGKRLPLS